MDFNTSIQVWKKSMFTNLLKKESLYSSLITSGSTFPKNMPTWRCDNTFNHSVNIAFFKHGDL